MRALAPALFVVICLLLAFNAPIESWLSPPTHTVIRVANLTSLTGGADTGFFIASVNDDWSRGHLLGSTTMTDVGSIALWPHEPVAGATPPMTFPLVGAPPWSVPIDTILASTGHQFDTGNLFAQILDTADQPLLQGPFSKVAQTRYELPVDGAGMVPPNPTTTDSGECDVVITDNPLPFLAGPQHAIATSCTYPTSSPFAHVHDAASGNILHDFSDVPEFPSATAQQLARFFLDPIDSGTAQVLRDGQWRIDLETAPFIGIGGSPGCRNTQTQVCARNRFAISANARNLDGQTIAGTGSLVTPDSGLFYFFDPDNLELLVNVLDACGDPNADRFWVFAGGLTDVEVTLTVTDTESNETKTYTNPLGTPFQPITDTSAFATCP